MTTRDTPITWAVSRPRKTGRIPLSRDAATPMAWGVNPRHRVVSQSGALGRQIATAVNLEAHLVIPVVVPVVEPRTDASPTSPSARLQAP